MRAPTLILIAFTSALFLSPVSAQEEKAESPKDSSGSKAETKNDPHHPESRSERKPEGASTSKRTWVGVATAGIDPALRQHLELEEGFGIQIVEVMPDSPAGKSGLRNSDIITHFDDQRLISPEHLSLLVKTKSGGDKVSIGLIRKGKPDLVEVTLGETDDNTFNRWHSPANHPHGNRFPPLNNRNDPRWQDSIKRHQDQMQEWMERNRPEPEKGGEGREKPSDQKRDSRKPGAPDRSPSGSQAPSISVSPGFPLRVFGMEGVLRIDNEKGELTLTRKDGKHHLEIKDKEGKVIHDGPFDPAAGSGSLPEEARRQLEIMKLGNFEILIPETPAVNPEKTGEKEKGTETEAPGEIL